MRGIPLLSREEFVHKDRRFLDEVAHGISNMLAKVQREEKISESTLAPLTLSSSLVGGGRSQPGSPRRVKQHLPGTKSNETLGLSSYGQASTVIELPVITQIRRRAEQDEHE